MTSKNTLGPSPIRFDDPKYQICYEYWQHLKGDRAAPAWREWDWFQLPLDLIPYCLVVDVEYDPLDFVYRFWGTANISMHGIDLTGKSISKIRSAVTAQNTFDQYNEVIDCREAIASAYTIQAGADGPPFVQTSLRMPFSDDGITVHQIATYADWSRDHLGIQENHLRTFGEFPDRYW